MRFRSPHVNKTFVVRPTTTQITNGFPQTVWGIRAVFRNGVFDSEIAQRDNRWDDETREMVEEYLLSHPEHGVPKGHFVVASNDEKMPDTKITENVPDVDQCIATYETPDGAELCGRAVLPGQDYCKEHAPVREAVS